MSSSRARKAAAYHLPGDVKRVYDMLDPKPKELLDGNVRFVREGAISHWNAKEKRVKNKHFFLFNRCLLVCKKEGTSKFWLKVYITLRPSIKVVDVEDSTYSRPGCEFRLYAPKKTFIFFASTPANKESWLRDINDCINGRIPEARSQSSAVASYGGQHSEPSRHPLHRAPTSQSTRGVALPDQPAYSSGSDEEDSESDDDFAFNPRAQQTQKPARSPGSVSGLSSVKLAPPPGAELVHRDLSSDFAGLSVAPSPAPTTAPVRVAPAASQDPFAALASRSPGSAAPTTAPSSRPLDLLATLSVPSTSAASASNPFLVPSPAGTAHSVLAAPAPQSATMSRAATAAPPAAGGAPAPSAGSLFSQFALSPSASAPSPLASASGSATPTSMGGGHPQMYGQPQPPMQMYGQPQPPMQLYGQPQQQQQMYAQPPHGMYGGAQPAMPGMMMPGMMAPQQSFGTMPMMMGQPQQPQQQQQQQQPMMPMGSAGGSGAYNPFGSPSAAPAVPAPKATDPFADLALF